MADKLDDLAASLGIVIPKLEAGTVENTGGFYEHREGGYTGMCLAYKETWVIEEGGKKKEVDAKTPGAKHYGGLRFAILQDPEKALFDQNFKVIPDIEYGRLAWNQYVGHDSDKQFFNKNLFEGFYIDGVPELSVVTGKGRDFTCDFRKFAIYYGAPVTFILSKKYKKGNEEIVSKTPFVLGAFDLKSHALDKDVLAKRKKAADFISAQLDEVLQHEKDTREAKKGSKGGVDAAPPDSGEDTSFLDQYK